MRVFYLTRFAEALCRAHEAFASLNDDEIEMLQNEFGSEIIGFARKLDITCDDLYDIIEEMRCE